MNIPQNLTPFSQSVLHPAASVALRRAAVKLGAPEFPISVSQLARPDGVRIHLAALTVNVWSESTQAVAHLLGVASLQSGARGKTGRGMKTAQQTLTGFPAAYGRLRRWSEWVFDSEWNQAQLLQVMEEVERMTAEALMWVYASAIAAVGSYAHLGRLIAKFEKNQARGHALRLGLTAGLETPDGRLIEALAAGAVPERLRKEFGHMPIGREGEMAAPRIAEAAEALIGTSSPPEPLMWDLSRAQGRQETARRKALAAAGFLGRSGLRKSIELTQSALITHAKARDALAFVLAATRHWAQAAAVEGMSDGRIQRADEIFLLEIEEIKQMMTGEWHSRGHIAPLLARRREDRSQQAVADRRAGVGPLGVAGEMTEGALLPMRTPADVTPPSGFIALAESWHPAWWRVLLRVAGVIAPDGDLLAWVASVARMGDLPTLVGGDYGSWPAGSAIRLDPSRNLVEMSE